MTEPFPRTTRDPFAPYRTKDRSSVRELIRPEREGSRHLSLAEATLAPGEVTIPHRHPQSEEIYYILQGHGRLIRGEQTLEVAAGEAILIPPDTVHALINDAPLPLKLLCCCSPPYQHDDTLLVSDP